MSVLSGSLVTEWLPMQLNGLTAPFQSRTQWATASSATWGLMTHSWARCWPHWWGRPARSGVPRVTEEPPHKAAIKGQGQARPAWIWGQGVACKVAVGRWCQVCCSLKSYLLKQLWTSLGNRHAVVVWSQVYKPQTCYLMVQELPVRNPTPDRPDTPGQPQKNGWSL